MGLRHRVLDVIRSRIGQRQDAVGGSSGLQPVPPGGIPYGAHGGSRTQNPGTGLGTMAMDKGAGVGLVDKVLGPDDCDVIYKQMWPAQKMIDIPIDDMLVPGRRWRRDKDNGDEIDKMEAAEEDLNVEEKLMMVMKAGRLYGTAMMVIVPKEGDLESEFKPEAVTPGSISHLYVISRYECSIQNWWTDFRHPEFGKPHHYRVFPVHPSSTGSFLVHSSRILRFDGRKPPTDSGWRTGGIHNLRRNGQQWWHRDYGISELTHAIDEFLRDAATHQGIGHLVQEASTFILKIQAFKEAIKGRTPPNEPTLEEIIEQANMFKSIYKIMAIDAEDEAERVTVSFAGLPQIMDRLASRLAAVADIPATRFLAQSPAGLDATGDSDMINYAVRIHALRRKLLRRTIKHLDMTVARNGGLEKPPTFDWLPILNIAPKDLMEIAAMRTKMGVDALREAGIDEDEFRLFLSKDPAWGDIDLKSDFTPPRIRLPGGATGGSQGAGTGSNPGQSGPRGTGAPNTNSRPANSRPPRRS